MELLIQLLAADNITVNNLESEIVALGYDPQTLTDAQAMEIAGKLKAKSSKAITPKAGKSAKPTKSPANGNRETRTDRTPSIDNGLGHALGHAVTQSVQEIEIIQSGVKAASEKIVTAKANEMLDQIADIPNATLQEFSKLAAQHSANPTFFQQRTDEIAGSILSAFGITET